MTPTYSTGDLIGGAASAATFFKKVKITCDDTYPDGGYPKEVADLLPNGAALVSEYPVRTGPTSDSDYELYWDADTGKIHVIVTATNAEAATGLDLTGLNCWFLLIAS